MGAATLIYGLGSFVPPLIGFLLIPLYTRLLTPTDYGIIELCSTISVVFFFVGQVGMPAALQRYYYDAGETPLLRDYVSTAVRFMLGVGGVTIVAAALVGPSLLAHALPGLPFYPFVLLALLASYFNLLGEMQRKLLQARERARVVAALTVSSGLAGIGATLFFVAGLRWSAFGALLSTAIVAGTFAAIAIVLMRRELTGRFVPAHLGRFLAYGLPLVPHALGGWLLDMANRVVLGGASVAEVGKYSLAMRFMMPLVILDGAFGTAFPPIYFSLRKQDDQESARQQLSSTATAVIFAFLWLYVATATLLRAAIRVMTPQPFHEAARLLPYLGVGVLLSVTYRLFANELFFSKRTQFIFVITIASGLVNVCGSLYLVPMLGGVGAAIAYCAGMGTLAFLTVIANRRYFRFQLPMPRLAAGAGLALGCVAGGIWCSEHFESIDLWIQLGLTVLYPLMLVGAGVIPKAQATEWGNKARETIARRMRPTSAVR